MRDFEGEIRTTETTEAEIKEKAFAVFEERVAAVRQSLKNSGHLELVTSEGYRAAQKELIEAVGRKTAELHLNHWFARNSVN